VEGQEGRGRSAGGYYMPARSCANGDNQIKQRREVVGSFGSILARPVVRCSEVQKLNQIQCSAVAVWLSE